jgi:hypothetical protein
MRVNWPSLKSWPLITAALASLGILLACGQGESIEPIFRPTYVLSSSVRYGVVTREFLAVLATPHADAEETSTVLRQRDVILIDGFDFTQEKGKPGSYWYRVVTPDGAGWVSSEAIDVYENEAQARKASEAK